MRFWGKNKYGEKKTSREKLICGADSLDGDSGDAGPLLGEGEYRNTRLQEMAVIVTFWDAQETCLSEY